MLVIVGSRIVFLLHFLIVYSSLHLLLYLSCNLMAFQDWIECRTQQTRVGTSLSAITSLIVLAFIGPLLFIFYINDILFDDKSCVCKLYADNVKLCTVIANEGRFLSTAI